MMEYKSRNKKVAEYVVRKGWAVPMWAIKIKHAMKGHGVAAKGRVLEEAIGDKEGWHYLSSLLLLILKMLSNKY
jgi:hypothetical protein